MNTTFTRYYFLILIFYWPVFVAGQNIPVPNITGPAGMQVNSLTGNLFMQRTDVVIPGQGFSIDATFAYNSHQDTLDYGYGKGWTLNYNVWYVQDEDTLSIYWGDGRVDDYQHTESGEYLPPPGIFNQVSFVNEQTLQIRSKHGITYMFEDSSHKKLTMVSDPNDNSLRFTYSDGLLSSIIDNTQRSISLEWANRHLDKVIDANGGESREVRYKYNSNDQLIQVITPMEYDIHYQYKDGNLISMIDENDHLFTVFYSSGGRVNRLCSELSTLSITYSPDSKKTFTTEESSAGKQFTTYEFDAQDRLIKKTGNCCGYNTSYLYDEDNNIAQMTDANGNTFRYTHDEKGNRLSETDPLGHTTSMTYEPNFNQIKSITDKNGSRTELSYDNQGNLTSVSQPEGVSQSYGYESGRITSATDGRNIIIGFEYDSYGYPQAIIYPTGREEYVYNKIGNLERMTDINGNAVSFTYDSENRIETVKDDLGNTTTYDYDGNGNLTEVIDANGYLTEYEYDELNRLAKVSSPAGMTQYAYDAIGNLTQITDAKGHITSYTYNNQNLVDSETDGAGFTTMYTYDGNGNLMSKSYPNGNLTTYTYDELNRLVGRQYPGNEDSYQYDPAGNLIRAANQNVSMAFQYDGLNRLKAQKVNPWNKTIQYTYDNAGNRETMIDPDGGNTAYTYDDNNRLETLENPLNQITSFIYDEAGRLTRQNNPNNTYTTYKYDVADRLEEIANLGPQDTISFFRYTHDKLGNRLSMATQEGLHEYNYDESHRLTQVSYADGVQETYDYDVVGNREQWTKGGQSTNYQYDEADRLEVAGNAQYFFDKNGNMTASVDGGDTIVYEYDGENRLITVQMPDKAQVRYSFDPFGHRIGRFEDGQSNYYLWDNENVLQELDNSYATIVHYTSGLEMDTWLNLIFDGQTYVYHQDGLGSTSEITNGEGLVANSYSYDAYGNLQKSVVNIPNQYTYTGRAWDEVTQIYYYRTRYYQPNVGRFLTKDTFSGFMSRPLSMNKYSYVEGNPISYIDPDGKAIISTVIIRVVKRISSAIRMAKYYSQPSIHCTRNQHNIMPDGDFFYFTPIWSEPGFKDLSGRKWIMMDQDKNIYHQPWSTGNIVENLKRYHIEKREAPNIKFVSINPDGSSSEAIWSTEKKRWLRYDEHGGPSFNFVDASTSYLGHYLADMYPSSYDCSGGNNLDNDEKDSIDFIIRIITAKDPNDILGPEGYDESQWISAQEDLNYTIRFENDPDFATAAALNVFIQHNLSSNININSFILGNYGFGAYAFSPPENRSYYKELLNTKDSLGVQVDFTGGVDIGDRLAFWNFLSVDPIARLVPEDVRAGFLPVNDSLGSGEGYVSFQVQPKNDLQTGDTIYAEANIVFDDNEAINTNRWFNTIDADAPASIIDSIMVTRDTTLALNISATDVGSGVSNVELYVTQENDLLTLVDNVYGSEGVLKFSGKLDTTYCFVTIATDHVGNTEGLKSSTNCQSLSADSIPITTIEEDLSKNIKIFPNPTAEIINIHSEQPILSANLIIADQSGRIHYQKELNKLTEETINIGAFASGVYLLYLEIAQKKYVYKIIKK